MKYTVYERYEYFSKTGKSFTKWFKTGSLYNTEAEAKEALKSNKAFCKDFDRITKYKHEFEVRYIDETLLPQIKLRRPKGRPKKVTIEEIDNILSKLYKSKTGSVKVDLQLARYLYNDNENIEYITSSIDKKYNSKKYPVFWYDEVKDDKIPYILLKDVQNDNN